MKFLHLSDLHLGKRVNEFSMIEDQKHILEQILAITVHEMPNAVLIAGDIYDKTVPSAEAVSLLDDFLAKLAQMHMPVFVISGNHDSPERIAFAASLLKNSGVYVSPVYNGSISPVTLCDEWGPADIYLLPYVKAVHVRKAWPEDDISNATEALSCAVSHMNIDPDRRNILVAHQLVTGSARCDSEELSIGDADNVDASAFKCFDYVALGHLHGPQNAAGERIRYCGSPLKYSFSEARHTKSVTIAELREKGSLSVRTIPLIPLRDMIEIRGTYDEVVCREFYRTLDTNSYVHITLTDENDIPEAVSKLRIVYPNLMKLDYDNKRTRATASLDLPEENAAKSPLELFAEFYENRNHTMLSDEQKSYLEERIKAIWEEGQA